jgi:transcriptional regulator NrdR family protein
LAYFHWGGVKRQISLKGGEREGRKTEAFVENQEEAKKMIWVIKRNGEKETFNARKLTDSINRAAKDAGIRLEREKPAIVGVAQRAIEMAAHKKYIESSVLRSNILDGLEQNELQVANAWEDYDREHKSREV